LIFGCNSSGPENKTDLEKMNLKGEVIFLVVEDSDFIEFNENGMKKKNIYYDKSYNDSYSESDFIYENGNLVKQIEVIIESDGKQKIRENIYQYQNGLLKMIDYDNGFLIREFFHDGKNNLIEEKSTLNFDGNPYITSTIYFYSNNQLDSTYQYQLIESNNKILQLKTSYDSNGKTIGLSSVSTTILLSLQYKDGLEIKEVTKSDNGISELSISYEFDQNGNWIKKISSSGSEEDEVEERKIFYKGDDFSGIISGLTLVKTNFKNGISQPQNSNLSSSNGSNQYSDGPTKSQNFGESQIPNKNTCYNCKGTGKCPKCTIPQNVRYKQGESPHDHKETRYGMIVCTQCGGNTMNWGHDKNESCYLCKATGWLYCRECNPNGNSSNIGQCQRCKGTGVY